MLCQTSNHFLGIKNKLLSHKNGICTFMRCGNLTDVGGCGGHGCYFQPNPSVISQISASHECTDTVFMT